MRYSQMLIPTLKETPAEAKVVSHVYLLRGGFMRQLAAGIYSFLPLGLRVVEKIARIIREEMNRAGAQEVLLPAVQPGDLWRESGRWEQYGPELLRFQDRKKNDFVIGPTHEEVIVDLVRSEVRSYRQLPVNLYQVQTKFRDEMRPRAGLMRGREFTMKDAYSFDVDEPAALRSYDAMYLAYRRIFTRCGLSFRPVEADTGNIGGSRSHEFQVLAASGEDAIVACDKCDYAANVEQAEIGAHPSSGPLSDGTAPALERVSTPKVTKAEEVAKFLGMVPSRVLKTMLYLADGPAVAAIVRADHEVNEIKLRKLLGAKNVVLASDAAVTELTGSPVGFAGPVGLKAKAPKDFELKIILDKDAVEAAKAGVACGANEADAHLVNAVLGRDFEVDQIADIRQAVHGDKCPRCEAGSFVAYKGIEVGHVFYLGTKYSKPMNCNFLDEKGEDRPMVMGCYGIGVTRTAAAAIEQQHDEKGISWPITIAPFQVTILPLQPNDAEVKKAADDLYAALTARGLEVLLDDRDERPGVKFAEADLIGVPVRVILGKKGVAAGKAELKLRRNLAEMRELPLANLAEEVSAVVEAERARFVPPSA